MNVYRTLTFLAVIGLCLPITAHAAFVAAVDLDPDDGPQTLHPNFSFGGDTTSASDSIASGAVGLVPHQSLFGGNGSAFADTYIMSYTPGTDVDNFSPSRGSTLGSVTGFGTELASGGAGGGSGTYKVYITVPQSTNVSSTSTATATGDGAPAIVGPGLNLNNGGTGADLDPGLPFVGGANDAWYLIGEVDLTAGTTYSLTLESSGGNTFVGQRLAGVMWELQIPEPSSLLIACMGLVGLAGLRRRS